MKTLAGSLAEIMVMELGPEVFLKRVSDPFWFQCFGCVLGFDWHSSGLTTTTCGALKEGLRGKEHELGLYVTGGKGGASRKTPDQIMRFSDHAGTDGDRLVYASRMSAKVDSSALQDGFQVYHHCFLFTGTGSWAVVQQGMNESTGWARRYHWLAGPDTNFVRDPHNAICSDGQPDVLNMVAGEADESRAAATAVSKLPPAKLLAELKQISRTCPNLDLPGRHQISRSDINPDRIASTFIKTYERQPKDFEELLGTPGVGPKTIRALSLVGQLIHGAKPSFRDPARFSFAHGGKDGIPYPVDRETYDTTADLLEKAIAKAKVGEPERLKALRRMASFMEKTLW